MQLRRPVQRARRRRRVAGLLALELGRPPQELRGLLHLFLAAGFFDAELRQIRPALALGEEEARALEDLHVAGRTFAAEDQSALGALLVGHAQAQIEKRQGLRRGGLATFAAQDLFEQGRALRAFARAGQQLRERKLQRALDGRVGQRRRQRRTIDFLGLRGIGLLDQIAQPPRQRGAPGAARGAFAARQRLREEGHGLADLPALLVDVGEQGQRLRVAGLFEENIA